jgi:chromate transport protein ChrA
LTIGALAFGGGSATIVAIRELALRRRWLSEEEFLETVVLSRVPSVTITILLARLYVSVRDQSWSQRPLEMITALAAGFAVALALLLLKDTLSVDRHWRGTVGFVCYVALGAVVPIERAKRRLIHLLRFRAMLRRVGRHLRWDQVVRCLSKNEQRRCSA